MCFFEAISPAPTMAARSDGMKTSGIEGVTASLWCRAVAYERSIEHGLNAGMAEEIGTVPDVKHENGKQCIGRISLASAVQVAQMLERFPHKNPLLCNSFPTHVVVEVAVEMVPHPDSERHVEASFRCLST